MPSPSSLTLAWHVQVYLPRAFPKTLRHPVGDSYLGVLQADWQAVMQTGRMDVARDWVENVLLLQLPRETAEEASKAFQAAGLKVSLPDPMPIRVVEE